MKRIKVGLSPVRLDGAYFGNIVVHDSLMIFWNPKLQTHFFNIFNLDTGEEIGTFCNKGQGPDEVAAVSGICQIFEEKKELKTLLFAANEKEINMNSRFNKFHLLEDDQNNKVWKTMIDQNYYNYINYNQGVYIIYNTLYNETIPSKLFKINFH